MIYSHKYKYCQSFFHYKYGILINLMCKKMFDYKKELKKLTFFLVESRFLKLLLCIQRG